MLRSLTGYGFSTDVFNESIISIEVKSINHKYLDINFKMPRIFNPWEIDFRNLIQTKIKRGRLNVIIDVQNPGNLYKKLNYDVEMAKKYVEALIEISKKANLPYDLTLKDVFNMKGVFEFKEEEPDEELKLFLKNLLDNALEKLIKMKLEEGKFLEKDILIRLSKIENFLEKIDSLKDKVVENYRKKLNEIVAKMFQNSSDKLDEKRLEFEIVMISDKADITEEITRMRSHIEKFKKTCNEEPPVGKKLDFILQEMIREINTIGSKNNLPEISELVIETKNQIESIREQVQNIE